MGTQMWAHSSPGSRSHRLSRAKNWTFLVWLYTQIQYDRPQTTNSTKGNSQYPPHT